VEKVIGDATIVCGHVVDVLRTLPEDSVDCVVTSPPYWGLRDYEIDPQVWDGNPGCTHKWGEEVPGDKRGGSNPGAKEAYAGDGKITYARQVARGNFCVFCGAWRGNFGLEPNPDLYVRHVVTIFEEVWRVLRPQGTCWLNLGDTYAGSWGAQSRDDGSGRNEIAQRLIQKAPKVSSRAGSIPEGSGLKPKDMVGIPWSVALALRAAGWWLRQDIIWSKPNAQPEAIYDRCTKSHEYVFLLTKSRRYYWDVGAMQERASGTAHARGTGVNPKSMKMPDGWDTGKGGHGSFHRAGREKGKTRPRPRQNPSFQGAVNKVVEYRNKRSVWEIATEPFSEAHFATYPRKLVEPCILAGCPPGGLVLDPFHGSGTSGVVALDCDRRYLGIEIKQEYVELSVPRIQEARERQRLRAQGFNI